MMKPVGFIIFFSLGFNELNISVILIIFPLFLLTKNKYPSFEIENKISDIKSKLMSADQKNIELKNINNKIDSLKKEVSQQENNLSFFNENSKENKLLKTVHDKIKKNKNELELLKKHKNKLLK